MTVVELLASSPPLYIGLVTLLGLMIGSFLNVVIHRLPIIMDQQWRAEISEIVGQNEPEPVERISLATPRSRCPACGHQITALENIPVLSYLFLKGKCAGCGVGIPARYPLVELATAALSALVVWHFGFTIQAAAALVFTWSLIPLCGIDIDHHLLPDAITLPLLWLGLTLSLSSVFGDTHTSIIGALAGYLSLWSVYIIFKLLTGKEGMGHGDFKLLAALGAWMGWQALPLIIILSSVVGAITGILLMVVKGRERSQPLPFGPYLAAAGWISLMWGEQITHSYLQWARIAT